MMEKLPPCAYCDHCLQNMTEGEIRRELRKIKHLRAHRINRFRARLNDRLELILAADKKKRKPAITAEKCIADTPPKSKRSYWKGHLIMEQANLIAAQERRERMSKI